MSRILIAGCGYVGSELARRAAAAGHEVFALRRHADQLPGCARTLQADLTRAESLRSLPERLDVVFYTAAADETSEEAYRAAYLLGTRNLLASLAQHGARPRFVFTSSTAVYAQSQGEWVDETSETAPTHFTGKLLLEAEQQVRRSGLDVVVLRLAGIYGPGRTSLLARVRDGLAEYSPGVVEYGNRIHRDDCAGALQHVGFAQRPDGLYVGADSAPVDRQELLRYLAERLGAPPPRPRTEPAPRRRGFSSKRCSNARLLAAGYAFEFPSFRDGYESLIQQS
ncbi:MAG: SDR family oxidoreductase [Polyangiaceae bacterium]